MKVISHFNFQAYYNGKPGPVNGGAMGPGTTKTFHVPENTEIVSTWVCSLRTRYAKELIAGDFVQNMGLHQQHEFQNK